MGLTIRIPRRQDGIDTVIRSDPDSLKAKNNYTLPFAKINERLKAKLSQTTTGLMNVPLIIKGQSKLDQEKKFVSTAKSLRKFKGYF